MNQSVQSFLDRAAADAELAARLQALKREFRESYAESLSQLATRAGFPFSSVEFLESMSELSSSEVASLSGGADIAEERGAMLDAEQMDRVAGGVGKGYMEDKDKGGPGGDEWHGIPGVPFSDTWKMAK